MTGLNLKEVKQRIDSLDLDPIKFKLMEEKGWSRVHADEMEQVYKGFLFLNAKNPEQPIVPSKALDEFWHNHILDTEKYMTDCETVFGYYLHHFPYFGIRDEQDAEMLQRAYSETQELFQRELGIDLKATNLSGTKAQTCSDSRKNSTAPVATDFADAATCYSNCGNRPPPTCRIANIPTNQARPSLK